LPAIETEKAEPAVWTILVVTLPEGCGCFGEGAEEVYQDVAGLQGISYEERLDKLGLFSLE